MKDLDQLLKESYKSEADEVWFQDLNFDSHMKDKVTIRVQPSLKRTAPGGWSKHKRTKWIYGAMTTAAAILLFILTVPLFNDLPSSNAPPNHSATPLNTSGNGPLSSQNTFWELHSVVEAQQAYGEGLSLPTYTPDGYTINHIEAYGAAVDEVNRVVLSYQSPHDFYDLTVERKGSLDAVIQDEKVRITHEIMGYLHSDEQIATSLFWQRDDHIYSIVGTLSRDEVIRIAQSIQP